MADVISAPFHAGTTPVGRRELSYRAEGLYGVG